MPSDTARNAIESAIDNETPEMLSVLEAFVNQDSGSYDTGDVNAMGDRMAAILSGFGCTIIRHPGATAGCPLSFFAPGTDPDGERILLIGHRDTVFPAGTAAKRPFRNDGARCHGPGVADQKGGLVAGIFAIKTLLALRDTVGHIPLEFFVSSDEEIGSGASAPALAQRCRNAKAVFSLEPARPGHAVVTSRDGGDLVTLHVHGKAAHAGNNFLDGASAINALAGITLELSRYSDDPAGLNVNFGVVSGGSGAIIVPDYASAKVYMRFSTLEQQTFLREKTREVVGKFNSGNIRVEMDGPVGFLPFRKSAAGAALYDLVKEAGAMLGMQINSVDTRGPADSGVTASAGIPTICGMGPVGGFLHTDEEYMETDSLASHAKLVALSVAIAAERYLA